MNRHLSVETHRARTRAVALKRCEIVEIGEHGINRFGAHGGGGKRYLRAGKHQLVAIDCSRYGELCGEIFGTEEKRRYKRVGCGDVGGTQDRSRRFEQRKQRHRAAGEHAGAEDPSDRFEHPGCFHLREQNAVEAGHIAEVFEIRLPGGGLHGIEPDEAQSCRSCRLLQKLCNKRPRSFLLRGFDAVLEVECHRISAGLHRLTEAVVPRAGYEQQGAYRADHVRLLYCELSQPGLGFDIPVRALALAGQYLLGALRAPPGRILAVDEARSYEMRMPSKLFFGVAIACAMSSAVGAQTRAGDKDDQFVARGCVARTAGVRSAGPQSLFLWSRGDVYLAFPDTRFKPTETARPVGTTGTFMPVFYWIDDEDDFAKYVGQRVEIVGELSDDFDKGEIEIEHRGDVTEIEFEVNGREAKASIPRAWLGPATAGKDAEFDVVVRTVDVEKVTVLGTCTSR